jgi:HEAT repeat protein
MATFFCPQCWYEVRPDATCCPGCGADLSVLDQAEFDEKLVRALGHPEPLTAIRAAEILGGRHSRRAVDALRERYRVGADPYLAAAIATALGRIGGQEARHVLELLAHDSSVIVRNTVEKALKEFEPDDTPRDNHEGRQE